MYVFVASVPLTVCGNVGASLVMFDVGFICMKVGIKSITKVARIMLSDTKVRTWDRIAKLL